MKKVLWLALLAPGLACAADVTGYLNAGVGFASRDIERDAPFGNLDLDYDDGAAWHVDGGVRLPGELLLTGSYTISKYGDFTAIDGDLLIADDSTQRDTRFGAFLAPAPAGGFAYRAGAGYALIEDTVGIVAEAQGLFVEAGAARRLGEHLRFTGAATLLQLHGDADREGLEVRTGLAYGLGSVDLTADARYLRLGSDELPDEHLYELRLGVGSAWGSPP